MITEIVKKKLLITKSNTEYDNKKLSITIQLLNWLSKIVNYLTITELSPDNGSKLIKNGSKWANFCCLKKMVKSWSFLVRNE